MKYFFLLFFIVIFQKTFSQTEYRQLSNDSLINLIPELNQSIDISVAEMPLSSFLRSIAFSNHINIILKDNLDETITNNFYNVRIINILNYLSEQYSLDLYFTGNIITVTKRYLPIQVKKSKDLNILHDTLKSRITVNLKNDTLFKVAQTLTSLTGKNIIIQPELRDKLINSYIIDDSLGGILDKLCLSNNLRLKRRDSFYELYIKESTAKSEKNFSDDNENSLSYIKITSEQSVDIKANNIAIKQLILELCKKFDLNYFLQSDITGNITINLHDINRDVVFDKILYDTKFSYIKSDNLYIFGEKTNGNLIKTIHPKLQYRSVVDISKSIPESLKADIAIIELPESNSLLISGTPASVEKLDNFIKEIDQLIPVVLIEVMIVEVQKSISTETGIKAGLGNSQVKTQGSILNGIDLTLNSNSLNTLINVFNGYGFAKLGLVTPNFYLSLKALEEQGFIKVRSTPRLATLNGHEASLKLGKTEYYLEETSQIFANQTTTQTKQRTFKSVNADFTLTITPVVSGDNQITLNIIVDQNDFTGTKIAADAPPNQISRKFSSIIRVKNEEMILLGGLEESSKIKNSSGIPLLSRIPILKRLFGNVASQNSSNKLNIFIKPILLY